MSIRTVETDSTSTPFVEGLQLSLPFRLLANLHEYTIIPFLSPNPREAGPLANDV